MKDLEKSRLRKADLGAPARKAKPKKDEVIHRPAQRKKVVSRNRLTFH